MNKRQLSWKQWGKSFIKIENLTKVLLFFDFLLIVLDTLGILNSEIFIYYIVIDTVSSAVLLWGWRKDKKSNSQGARGERFKNVLTLMGSLPWVLMFIILGNYIGALPDVFVLARILRFVPRAIRPFTQLTKLARLGNQSLWFGILTAFLWAIVLNLKQANRTPYIILAEISWGLIVFALVYDIRQRFSLPRLEKWFNHNDEIGELKNDIERLRQPLEQALETINKPEMRKIYQEKNAVLTDFCGRDLADIEISLVDECGESLQKVIHHIDQGGMGKMEKQELSLQLEEVYAHTRDIVNAALIRNMVDLITHAALFIAIFYGAFWLAPKIGSYGIKLLINTQEVQTKHTLLVSWITNLEPSLQLVLGIIGIILFYVVLRRTIHLFVRSTITPLDDLAGAFIPIPVAAFLFTDLMKTSQFDWYTKLVIGSDTNHPVNLLSLIIWIIVAIGLFNGVVIFALKIQAERTETQYDDILVKLLQRFGAIFIPFIGVVVTLPKLEWSSQGMMASLIATLASAGLLYIGRDFAENFFSGIYLIISKPFQQYDRIQLGSGEVCDVVEMGITAIRLYRVMDSTEVSMPNTTLARQGIANLSRPDTTLRMENTIWFKDTAKIPIAKQILLAILWENLEVIKVDFKEALTLANTIAKRHPTVQTECNQIISDIEKAKLLNLPSKINWDDAKDDAKDELEKLTTLDTIIGECKQKTLSLLDRKLELIRPDVQRLFLVFSKHPVITPHFISSNGVTSVALTLIFFTNHIERQQDLIGKINEEISEKFIAYDIPLTM